MSIDVPESVTKLVFSFIRLFNEKVSQRFDK